MQTLGIPWAVADYILNCPISCPPMYSPVRHTHFTPVTGVTVPFRLPILRMRMTFKLRFTSTSTSTDVTSINKKTINVDKHNIKKHSRKHCCSGKAVLHTMSVCLQSWLLRMQSTCVVLYCHLRPLWLHHNFPHYLVNGTIFEKKLLNTKYVFWFYLQLLSQTFLILGRIQRDIVINVNTSLCKAPLIHVRF